MGIWDMGFGIWDLGYGIWDMGYGIWDFGFGILHSTFPCARAAFNPIAFRDPVVATFQLGMTY
jgi:hypothetical protein